MSKNYTKLKHLGDGATGVVFLGKFNDTEQLCALKMVRIGSKEEAKEGISRSAHREIRLLRELSHKNVIKLYDVFAVKANIYLVLELCHCDLKDIILSDIHLTPSDIKSVMIQTLSGIEYMHRHWILHRDLKPENLFVTRKGVVKVADFGLASTFGSPSREYTPQVVTRYYRAPELLFSSRAYTGAVDIWALGCIYAEMELKRPFLMGSTDLNQIVQIANVFGAPSEAIWPGVSSLSLFFEVKPDVKTSVRDVLKATSLEGVELVSDMMKWDPNQRLTASQALGHKYFSSAPGPTPPSKLPLPVRPDPADVLKEHAKQQATADATATTSASHSTNNNSTNSTGNISSSISSSSAVNSGKRTQDEAAASRLKKAKGNES